MTFHDLMFIVDIYEENNKNIEEQLEFDFEVPNENLVNEDQLEFDFDKPLSEESSLFDDRIPF